MTVKERIVQYLNYSGVSITKAESELGWSKGALLKAASISSDRAGEFIIRYPNVSAEWLITGKGEMLKQSQSVGDISNSNVSGVNVSGQEIHISNADAYSTLLKIVENNQKAVEVFQSQIDRLITILERKIQ